MNAVIKSMVLASVVLVSACGTETDGDLIVSGYVFENKDGSITKVACRVENRKCMVETDKVDETIDGNALSLSFPENYYTSEMHLSNKDGDRIFTLYLANSLPYEITYWKKQGVERYDSSFSEKKTLDFDAKAFYKDAL